MIRLQRSWDFSIDSRVGIVKTSLGVLAARSERLARLDELFLRGAGQQRTKSKMTGG